MKLVLYIDSKLLVQDPVTNKPKLGNLTLARKVGGTANVVFQSKTTDDFSNANEFQWNQSLKIGAYSIPPVEGVFVCDHVLFATGSVNTDASADQSYHS